MVAAGERKMIQSVFDLGDTNAREVMVPRPEMIWIEADKTITQAANLAVRSGHSRIPVIGENPDDILGVLYLKDVVAHALGAGDGPMSAPGRSVRSGVHHAGVRADAARRVHPGLQTAGQGARRHAAHPQPHGAAGGRYGGIAGLVTIEDVLEEIVGEITDEYDTDEVAPVEELGDGVYRVSARLPVEDPASCSTSTSMTTRWRPSVAWSVCGSGGCRYPARRWRLKVCCSLLRVARIIKEDNGSLRFSCGGCGFPKRSAITVRARFR